MMHLAHPSTQRSALVTFITSFELATGNQPRGEPARSLGGLRARRGLPDSAAPDCGPAATAATSQFKPLWPARPQRTPPRLRTQSRLPARQSRRKLRGPDMHLAQLPSLWASPARGARGSWLLGNEARLLPQAGAAWGLGSGAGAE